MPQRKQSIVLPENELITCIDGARLFALLVSLCFAAILPFPVASISEILTSSRPAVQCRLHKWQINRYEDHLIGALPLTMDFDPMAYAGGAFEDTSLPLRKGVSNVPVDADARTWSTWSTDRHPEAGPYFVTDHGRLNESSLEHTAELDNDSASEYLNGFDTDAASEPQKKRRRLAAEKGGFRCEFPGCGKAYNRQSELSKHQRYHQPESERPYQCDTCGKRFLYPKDVRKHQSVHAGQDRQSTNIFAPAARDADFGNGDDAHAYRFERLDQEKREFRIVLLFPGPPEGKLTCSMIHSTLAPQSSSEAHRPHRPAGHDRVGEPRITSARSELLHYEAVSYAWGRATDEEAIYVETSSGRAMLPLRRNLANALRCLRRLTQPRRLWVDALCMNLNDWDERSSQVTLMADIFSQASNVCVWLGEEGDGSQLALDFLSKRVNDLNAFQDITSKAHYKEQWRSLAALMTREWFSRLWVVQEIAPAKAATIHCGNSWTDWADFETGVALLVNYAPQIARLFQTSSSYDYDSDFLGDVGAMDAARLVSVKSDIFRRDEDGNIVEYRFSLGELVVRLSSFEKNIPHDSIYAVLGLASDTRPSSACQSARSTTEELTSAGSQSVSARGCEGIHQTGEEEEQARTSFRQMTRLTHRERKIVPDYELPFFEVCKQFLNFTIRGKRGHNLDILCHPWAPKDQSEELPSWIPSLSRAPLGRRAALHRLGTYETTRKNFDPLVRSLAPGASDYNADGGQTASSTDWRFGENRSLFVTGFILDHIGPIEDYSHNGDIPADWLKLGNWGLLKKQANPPEELWRTLVADRGSDGSNPKVYYPMALKFAAQYSTPENGLETANLLQRHNPILNDFLSRVKAVAFNRRLFRGEWLRKLGLAPKEAKEGDCKYFRFCDR